MSDRNGYRDEQPGGGEGWPGQNERERGRYAGQGERRTWEPPYGDERTYGRQGQRGGSREQPSEGHGERPDGDYSAMGQGQPTYGDDDYSAARRSRDREGYRYGDSGWATGEGGYNVAEDARGGGQGGYSGYGSSGKGQYGPGGFPRGGYGQSGYGRSYGQTLYGADQRRGPEDQVQGQYRAGEGGYGQGDLGPGGGYEGVYGEGAGRSGGQGRYGETSRGVGRGAADYEPYGSGDRTLAAHGHEFEPEYLEWRRNQMAGYDRDYNEWRERRAREHDDEYRRWREERRNRFHQDFHGWRESRSGPGLAYNPISPSTTGVSYTGQSPSGGGVTAGFATHEISGATNADMSRETSSGRAGHFTGQAGGAPDERTRIYHGSGEGGDGQAVSGGSAEAARAIDPAIENIAQGGEGRADVEKEARKAERREEEGKKE